MVLWMKKAWTWIKANSTLLLFVAVGIILLLLGQTKQLKKLFQYRKEMMEKDETALKNYVEETEKIRQWHESATLALEKELEIKSEKLTKEHKKAIVAAVKEAEGNPEAFAKKINDLWGLDYVPPESLGVVHND